MYKHYHTSASIPVNNAKNSGKHRQQHRYELSVIFSYLYHYLFFLSSNNLSDPTIQLLLFSFFIHHSSACNAVQASGKKRQPSLPELRAACKRNHLKISGNKLQLKKRLLNPDSYRVMCGGVSLKLTSDFEIEHLHTIKQRYKQIGHPNQNNIQLWRDHLVGFQGENSHIYAMANDLKKDAARFDLITPVKAVSSSSSSSSSSSIALSMSSSASSSTSEKDKRSAINAATGSKTTKRRKQKGPGLRCYFCSNRFNRSDIFVCEQVRLLSLSLFLCIRTHLTIILYVIYFSHHYTYVIYVV